MYENKGKPWSEEDCVKLQEVYPTMGKEEMIDLFKRSYASIQKQANTLGLARKSSLRKIWTDYEINYLLENYDKQTIKRIANALDKTEVQIRNKRKELGLNLDLIIKKWDKEAIEELCISREYELVDFYRDKDNDLRLMIVCPKGHSIDTLLNSFVRSKNGCKVCSNCTKYDYDYIKSEFMKKGYTLISTDYINAHEALLIECSEGHAYEQAWNDFQQGSGCGQCAFKRIADEQKIPFEEVQDRFSQRGYKLISTEYINSKEKLEYICPFHPESVASICLNSLTAGHGCKLCQNDKLREDRITEFSVVKRDFEDKGFVLISSESSYKNCFSELEYICSKHSEDGIQSTTYTYVTESKRSVCKKCYNELSSGENSPSWKGGITEIQLWLRGATIDWKKESIKACGYKCVITGDSFDHVHHLYGFSIILQDVFEKTGITVRPRIKDYTVEELQKLSAVCSEEHKNRPLGVCLRKDIHKLFHEIYGYGDNTPDQFEEFKQRYYGREFEATLIERSVEMSE